MANTVAVMATLDDNNNQYNKRQQQQQQATVEPTAATPRSHQPREVRSYVWMSHLGTTQRKAK